jgi:DNA repair protein RadD
MKLRPYQVEAVAKGSKFLVENLGGGALMVLPTGSGKSIIIAAIANDIPGNTLVLQPSKELLEQNYSKMCFYMGPENIGIFSASVGRKDFGKITFATIGSIINRKEEFSHFDQIIIDECHLVNSKGGMYENLISSLKIPVLGLTATPYRLYSYVDMHTDSRSVVAKFLHRTRPRIFKEVIHVTQIQELYEQGYLCPIDYSRSVKGYDRSQVRLNSTGMDFDEESLMKYQIQQNVTQTVKEAIENSDYNHILVFASSVMEANEIAKQLSHLKVACVSAETKKDAREEILRGFKSGDIRVVTNVGVLTTGFDFPELDCIILARPTQSVALYYQMLGRGIRIAPGKQKCFVIDICGNVEKFGRIETFEIIEPKKQLHRLKSDASFLTGYDFFHGEDLESTGYANKTETNFKKNFQKEITVLSFGKFKGQKISEVPDWYLKFIVDKFDDGWVKDNFKKELDRRQNNKGDLPF